MKKLLFVVVLACGCEPARDKALDVERVRLVRELAETKARATPRLAECDAVDALPVGPSTQDAKDECVANRKTFGGVVREIEAKIADIDSIQPPKGTAP